VQTGVGRQKLLQKGGIQTQKPVAGVEILKPETKPEITLIGTGMIGSY
jgi:hypothetical protein